MRVYVCARASIHRRATGNTHTLTVRTYNGEFCAHTNRTAYVRAVRRAKKKIQNANVPIAVSHLLGLTISNSVVSHSANIPRTFSLACMLCMYKENYICRSAMMSVLYRRVLFAVRATVHRVCLCVCVCAGEKETMRR